jgi:hypothetical protein
MAYGHAERNLAAIRRLEAETEELLSSLPQSGSGQPRWLQQTAKANSQQPGASAPGSRAASMIMV